jgi:hypothetical protein
MAKCILAVPAGKWQALGVLGIGEGRTIAGIRARCIESEGTQERIFKQVAG